MTCSEKSPVLIKTLNNKVPTIEIRPPCHENRFLTDGQPDSGAFAGATVETGAADCEAAMGIGCGPGNA
jgi:hypothetical protein